MKTPASLFFVFSAMATLPSISYGAEESCTSRDKPLVPIMATHLLPPYPEDATRLGQQGTVLMKVQIGSDGIPTAVETLTSSGSESLDLAARDFLKSTWRWDAPVKGCESVATETRVSMRFDVKDIQTSSLYARSTFLKAMQSDYPADAFVRGEKGVTVLAIYLPGKELAAYVPGKDQPGVFVEPKIPMSRSQIDVVKGSGFPDLDARAVEMLKSRQWGPGTADGSPVKTTIFIGVIWEVASQSSP